MSAASGDRPLFVLTLRPEPHVDGLRALRAALRTLLRRHGLRCVALRQLGSDALVPEPGAEQRVASRGSVHDQ